MAAAPASSKPAPAGSAAAKAAAAAGMTTYKLTSMLGIRPSLYGCISYLDETDVQYVCGRNLVRYDTETRVQDVLCGSKDSLGITAACVSPKGVYSAYAEYGSDRVPRIEIYEWGKHRSRKSITGLEHAHAAVTHMAFTADGRNLLVVTGAPEWTLHYVMWDKGANGKVLASVKYICPPTKLVSQVDAHPSDAALVAVTGRGFFKLFRFSEDALKPVQFNLRREPGHFTSHAWLPDDRMVVATLAGELWLLEGTEFKRVLEGSPGKPVTAVAAFSKGFLAACDGGMLRVFEKSEDARLYYKLTKTFTVGSEDTSRICGMALSVNEEDLAVVAASGQAYSFKLANYELYKPGDLTFKPLIALFHSPPIVTSGSGALNAPPGLHVSSSGADLDAGPSVLESVASVRSATSAADPWAAPVWGITGLDTCTRKPVFVTTGADRTVRVWNYSPASANDATGAATARGAYGTANPGDTTAGAAGTVISGATPSLELVQRFAEVPACVAMHPSALHILVGFESSLHLMNILMDSIKLSKEFPIRNCGEAHFSNGGALFAAVNGSSISVYGTYTCAPVVTLRAHTDRVLAFTWSRDDRFIVSVGRDGMIIRHAVVVPNATSATQPGGVAAAPGGAAGGAAPSAAAPGSLTSFASIGGTFSVPPAAAAATVGKPVNTIEIRDFMPLAIACGAADNGRDVYVSGVVTRAGVCTSVFRHVDLAVPLREAVKSDMRMSGNTVRALASVVSARAVLAGLGGTIERSKQGPEVIADAASAPRLQERILAPPAGGSGMSDAGSVGGPSVAVGAAPSMSDAAAGVIDMAGLFRTYRSGPLSADASEIVAHAGPITRMVVTPDERVAITVGEDATIAVFTLIDTRPRSGAAAIASAAAAAAAVAAGTAPAGPEEHLPWADEILVTRADLEEVRKERLELEARVQEITMTNKYNERYKDMTNEEKIREIEEKFAEELKADRAKHEALRDAKADMEAMFEQQLSEMEETHARALYELEETYKAKIQAEMERYDSLVKHRDAMNEDFDNANAGLVKEHAAAIKALTERYEAAIRAEQEAAETLDAKKAQLQEEFHHAADDVEGDVDGEMEDLRTRYERKLATESTATLLLRGENGFMKSRFKTITKDISEQKEEMAHLSDKEKELHEAILALQKDVQGHKKEIREREETIADKEARIYDLKKKNQELEKFKFVLNYKIQELKRQIMPRKREIQDMREQMKEMELELLQYHKSNAALDLMISELKLKRDGMQREVDRLDASIIVKEDELSKIARDVAAVQSVARDPKALRTAVTRLYHKYIHGDTGNLAASIAGLDVKLDDGGSSAAGASSPSRGGVPVGVDVEDVQKELARQRQYLERNVDSLRRKLEKDASAARSDQARLMRENTVLTQEINELRRDLRFLQADMARAAADPTHAAAAAATGRGGRGGAATTTVAAAPTLGSSRRTAAVFGVVSGSASGLKGGTASVGPRADTPSALSGAASAMMGSGPEALRLKLAHLEQQRAATSGSSAPLSTGAAM